MIIESEGKAAVLSWRRPASPTRSDIMPTLPRNMAVLSRISDESERAEVTPSEDPTVNSAEQLSNSNSRVGSSGSSSSRVME